LIIEHVFITTLEGAEAMRLAAELLGRGGFAALPAAGFAPVSAPGSPGSVGSADRSIDMSRGRPAGKAKSVGELPQRVRVDFDRGRVTVAASIEYYEPGSFTIGSRREPPPHSPKVRPHIELMHAIIGGLEAALSRGMTIDDAVRPWAELEARLREDGRRRRLRRNIILWSVFGSIVLLIVLVISMTAR
jgi:hypothetical protein